METPQIAAQVEPGQRSAPGWLKSCGPAVPVITVFVFLAARMFRLISKYAVNIFFWDQWDLNEATLFQRHSMWQMFAQQHGPHRQGLGNLFDRMIEPLFAWNSRTEAFVIGAVIVAAAICALLVKKRLYGSLSVSDVAIPAIFFTPAQYESLFGQMNFAHGPLPLFLVVFYCLAWTEPTAFRYPIILIINFLTIYTGFGFFLGILTPVLLVLDYRARNRESRLSGINFVCAMAVAVGSLASFFVGYTFNPASMCFSFQPHRPRSYVAYVGIMLAHFFGMDSFGRLARNVGITILIALAVALVIAIVQSLRCNIGHPSEHKRARPVVITALIAYCLLFCFDTAYGRLCSGIFTALASRYVIYLGLGFFGFYLYVLSVRGIWTKRVLTMIIVAAVLAGCWHVDRDGMAFFSNTKQRWKTCYLQIQDIPRCDQIAGHQIHPRPGETHLANKLQFLKEKHLNLYLESK